MRLTIQSKLLVILLVIGLGATAITSFSAYKTGTESLQARIESQLTSVRTTRAQQVIDYVRVLRDDIRMLAQTPSTLDALQEFTAGWTDLEQNAPLVEGADNQLDAWYDYVYLPKTQEGIEGTLDSDRLYAKGRANRWLQLEYIVKNPQADKRPQFDGPDLPIAYAKTHHKYHKLFRSLIEQAGHYDLYLITPEGQVVYNVSKEPDFATDLSTGPFRQSQLARVVNQLKRAQTPGVYCMSDYESYLPSAGIPASFIASPIFDGSRLAGYIAFEISLDKINHLMTANRDWRGQGLGDTGETYLVGTNSRLYSESRFYLEDPAKLEGQLRDIHTSERILNAIKRLKTTVLQLALNSEAAQRALKGQTGTTDAIDYRGQRVFASYQPLEIDDMRWGLVAKMDYDEVFAPVRRFVRTIAATMAAIMLGVVILSLVFSPVFTTPLTIVQSMMRQVIGRETVTAPRLLANPDEFGQLARTVQELDARFSVQDRSARDCVQRLEQWVGRYFPPDVARSVRDGAHPPPEALTTAYAVIIDVVGLRTATDALQQFKIWQQVVGLFDAECVRLHLDKIAAYDGHYVAAAGLSGTRLDHADRLVELARSALTLSAQVASEHGLQISLRVGIGAGAGAVGVVGARAPIYELTGPVIAEAHRAAQAAEMGTILVTTMVRERLVDPAEAKPAGALWRVNR